MRASLHDLVVRSAAGGDGTAQYNTVGSGHFANAVTVPLRPLPRMGWSARYAGELDRKPERGAWEASGRWARDGARQVGKAGRPRPVGSAWRGEAGRPSAEVGGTGPERESAPPALRWLESEVLRHTHGWVGFGPQCRFFFYARAACEESTAQQFDGPYDVIQTNLTSQSSR